MPVSPPSVDPGEYLKFKLLTPKEAVEFFTQKGYHLGFDWRDTLPEKHKVSFTMAKIMQIDVLEDIRAAFTDGLKQGLPPEQIVKNLKNTLADKGWWGEREVQDNITGEIKTVTIGPHRLKRAYNINLATAHSEGKWQRIQDRKEMFPYLQYHGCNSAENRETHCGWNNLVLPVDNPWWPVHMPVKEPGCKCWVQSLTAGQVARRGLKVGFEDTGQAPPEAYTAWENQRTGKTERVPMGVHPMFNYPAGGWADHAARYAADRVAGLSPELRDSVGIGMRSVMERALSIPHARRFVSELQVLADNGKLDKSLLTDSAALAEVSRYINALGQGGRIQQEIMLGGVSGSSALLHELTEARELAKAGFDIYDPADMRRIKDLFDQSIATHQPKKYIPFHLAALRKELEYAQAVLRRRGVEADLGMIAKALYLLEAKERMTPLPDVLDKTMDELNDLGIPYPWGMAVPRDLIDALQSQSGF